MALTPRALVGKVSRRATTSPQPDRPQHLPGHAADRPQPGQPGQRPAVRLGGHAPGGPLGRADGVRDQGLGVRARLRLSGRTADAGDLAGVRHPEDRRPRSTLAERSRGQRELPEQRVRLREHRLHGPIRAQRRCSTWSTTPRWPGGPGRPGSGSADRTGPRPVTSRRSTGSDRRDTSSPTPSAPAPSPGVRCRSSRSGRRRAGCCSTADDRRCTRWSTPSTVGDFTALVRSNGPVLDRRRAADGGGGGRADHHRAAARRRHRPLLPDRRHRSPRTTRPSEDPVVGPAAPAAIPGARRRRGDLSRGHRRRRPAARTRRPSSTLLVTAGQDGGLVLLDAPARLVVDAYALVDVTASSASSCGVG